MSDRQQSLYWPFSFLDVPMLLSTWSFAGVVSSPRGIASFWLRDCYPRANSSTLSVCQVSLDAQADLSTAFLCSTATYAFIYYSIYHIITIYFSISPHKLRVSCGKEKCHIHLHSPSAPNSPWHIHRYWKCYWIDVNELINIRYCPWLMRRISVVRLREHVFPPTLSCQHEFIELSLCGIHCAGC